MKPLLNFPRIKPIYAKGAWWFPIEHDDIFRLLESDQAYEQHELNFIQSLLQPGQTFWDIGANFGLYAVLAAKKIGRHGHILAVEPDPKNLKRLRLNRMLNRLNFDIAPVALGECEEETEFCSCSQGAYSGLRVAEVPGEIRKISVQKTTLDCLAAKRGWPEINLMKMDVEGAELLVLRGGEYFFQVQTRPIILAEFSDRRSMAFRYSSSEVYEWLARRNYTWFAFDFNGKLVEQPCKLSYDYENLVGCPVEKLDYLSHWINSV